MKDTRYKKEEEGEMARACLTARSELTRQCVKGNSCAVKKGREGRVRMNGGYTEKEGKRTPRIDEKGSYVKDLLMVQCELARQ